jgi:hypothetical protein
MSETSESKERKWSLNLSPFRGKPREDYVITSESQLIELTDELIRQREGCGFLKNDEICLLFGVEGDKAIGHYYLASAKGDYFWAISSHEKSDGYIEFNIGGTSTEIPMHRCISIDVMVKIVRHFYRTGRRIEGVDWETDE